LLAVSLLDPLYLKGMFNFFVSALVCLIQWTIDNPLFYIICVQ